MPKISVYLLIDRDGNVHLSIKYVWSRLLRMGRVEYNKDET